MISVDYIYIFTLIYKNIFINPLNARIFTVFGLFLLEDRVLLKEPWVAKLLGTHLSIKVHKKVKSSRKDISSLTVKQNFFY